MTSNMYYRFVDDFMVVTILTCWWQNHYGSYQHLKSVTKISILSSHFVFNTRDQHQFNLGRIFRFQHDLKYWIIFKLLLNDRNSDMASVLNAETLFKICVRPSVLMVHLINTLEKLNLKKIIQKIDVSKILVFWKGSSARWLKNTNAKEWAV